MKLWSLVASLVLSLALCLFLMRPGPVETSGAPAGSIYYIGPMKQKGGDIYATPDGKTVTEEQAKQAALAFQAELDRKDPAKPNP